MTAAQMLDKLMGNEHADVVVRACVGGGGDDGG
jgi:hypothetical protein